ncbi:hypothetical protein [Duganella callida]|uniref:hypothetical protein n=1 Tax=Duganella callida TaxID=2561932 RepID=UPI00197AAD9B|nr:hypothetical protein [Duganella callida]
MNDQNASVEGDNATNTNEAEMERTAEGQIVPLVPPAAKTILVVDDELFQLKKVHVRNLAARFYDTIEDTNDPIFDNLWDIAKAVPGLGAADWDHDTAAEYFKSDAAVSTLLLSQTFEQVALEPLKQLLAPFTARAIWVRNLKQVFQDAFQAPEFNLEFVASPRPPFGKVSQCAAIFLDLFLEQGEASPVTAVETYLQRLATEAALGILPPLVLMSSHPELVRYKLSFSENAGISAAGLMVLPKDVLMQPEFSASGLKLAFKQLDRQKGVAHAMRLFMASWLAALDGAKKSAARTLWNLDASAMQQIHFASVSDDDPYDEHLNEYLSREHLFHVEAQTDVASTVAELDKQFRAQLTPEGQIENRLISPLADVKTARAFVSHFTWFGSALPTSFMDDERSAAARISRTLPFGSVLGPEKIGDGSRCLIHITQQCDLNAISRNQDPSRTLVFATANTTELRAASNPIVKPNELVAKNLRIGHGADEREFDLRLNTGALIAMPLREFLEKTRTDGWHVVGRLRSDITNHIVAAITNHMSRPASQKIIRPGLLRSKIFLQHASFQGGKIALVDKEAAAEQKPAKVFFVSYDDAKYSFEDDASIEIALWLAYHAGTIGLDLDPDLLSAALRRGWTSPSELPGGVKVRFRECQSLNAAYKGLIGGDIGGGGAQLTIISEG